MYVYIYTIKLSTESWNTLLEVKFRLINDYYFYFWVFWRIYDNVTICDWMKTFKKYLKKITLVIVIPKK